MINDSSALKFDPQVMALAMPQESAFTKAAEGIGNLGKVFLDADARKEASALNALKMEEANQSIIGKTNENSVFVEKQDREAGTWRETQRKAKLDFDMLTRKNEGEIKALEDSGTMEKLSGQIKTPDFFDGKTINLDSFNASRNLTLQDPKMAGREHIVYAMYDKKFKELNDLLEGTLKNGKTQVEIKDKEATTAGTLIDNQYKPQDYKDKSDHSKSATNLNNVNATLAPEKARVDQQHKAWLENKEAGVDNANTKKTWADNINMGRMEHIVPGYNDLDAKTQQYTNLRYGNTGQVPTVVPVSEGDDFGEATHKVQWKKAAPVKVNPHLPPLPPILSSTRPVVSKAETPEQYIKRLANKK